MAGRILLAEDLASNRILMRARLTAAHYGVLLAESLGEVVARARAERPDVVMIGLSEPQAAVLDVCRALKADPATAAIAIVALGGGGGRASRLAALAAGADDVLARGASELLMLARIRNLMRARHDEADLALRQETREALGFAEPTEVYQKQDSEPPGSIALVAAKPETARAWQAALRPHLRDRIEAVDYASLFDAEAKGLVPDVFVIATDLARRHDGLSLIADLKSRSQLRNAGIVAVTAPGDAEAAVAAFDLGAGDVVEQPLDALELVERLRAQLRRKARADRLRRQLTDGLKLAVTDPLTGLKNRRYALSHLARIAERAERTARPFAVMVLDLDRFKRVNDSFGHAAGDAVLIEAARRIAGGLRADDLVARLGGEEFLAVMPDTGETAACAAAERIRRLIEATPFRLPGTDGVLTLTVSIGIAIGGAFAAAGAVEALVNRADSALYSAKAAGRNRATLSLTAA